jgi:hypothetical protein
MNIRQSPGLILSDSDFVYANDSGFLFTQRWAAPFDSPQGELADELIGHPTA